MTVCLVQCVVLFFARLGTVRNESRTDCDTNAVYGGLYIGLPTSANLVASRTEDAELGRGVCQMTSGSQRHNATLPTAEAAVWAGDLALRELHQKKFRPRTKSEGPRPHQIEPRGRRAELAGLCV